MKVIHLDEEDPYTWMIQFINNLKINLLVAEKLMGKSVLQTKKLPDSSE